MTNDEFMVSVIRTAKSDLSLEGAKLNAILGLAGEVGEVVELIKKETFHDKYIFTDDYERELGDVLFYLFWLVNLLDLDVNTIMEKNKSKLEARYPNGFVPGGGIRDANK